MALIRKIKVLLLSVTLIILLVGSLSQWNGGEDLPIRLLANTPSGSECWTSRGQNGSLSIHMVVVPFLNYNTSKERIEAREAEYKHVLQKNLAHPLVQCVHILTTNYTETAQRFKDLENRSRMLVSEVESTDFARDIFGYISKNLLGRDAMFANADIYLGKGFEHVDPNLMDRERIVYALTRQVAPEKWCRETYTGKDKCLEARYTGSHDVFLFRLHEPLPEEEFLKPLGFELASPGIENVLIWLFRKRLRYCPLNPCSILESFHYHCSYVRNRKDKKRVNHSMSGLAPFTQRLNCSGGTKTRRENDVA